MRKTVVWTLAIVKFMLASISLSAALVTGFFVMLMLKLTGNWDLSWWWVCSPFILIYSVGLLVFIYEAGRSAGE